MELVIHDLRKDISYSIEFIDANDMNLFLSYFNANTLDIKECIDKGQENAVIFKDIMDSYLDQKGMARRFD